MSTEDNVGTLQQVLDGFNKHDLDAIMSHFTDDCVWESPRGPDRWGRRFTGKDEVRRGFEARFQGLPDVHYGGDERGEHDRQAGSDPRISTADG